MKRTLCIFLSLLIAVFCCACGDAPSDDSGQVVYYYSPEFRDDMVDVMERYNRWCSSHASEDMKIKLVSFEDFDTMSQRMNIEVMSGGGPDLFSNYMDLPFEKLMQNGAFLDLNELIENDTAADRIDLSAYNRTVMDAGVFNGKRYLLPAFYKVHTLIGEKTMLEDYGMPTEQGFHLTYGNMNEVLKGYLEDPDGCCFTAKELYGEGMDAEALILQLIDSRVDFESKTIRFDDVFKEQLEMLTKLRELSDDASADVMSESAGDADAAYLFNPYKAYSNPIWMERAITGGRVLYTCFEPDDATYSACIKDGVFVNANTRKKDKVLAFLKYLISEHLQNLFTGTDEEYWSGGGSDCLPVLNSALDNCIRDAHNVTDVYGDTVGKKEELTPSTQALISHVDQINSVSLYSNLYTSYYNKNVALPILRDYWDGKISVEKCIVGLTTATKIYVEE